MREITLLINPFIKYAKKQKKNRGKGWRAPVFHLNVVAGKQNKTKQNKKDKKEIRGKTIL